MPAHGRFTIAIVLVCLCLALPAPGHTGDTGEKTKKELRHAQLFDRGSRLSHRGRYARAVDLFTRALAQKPDHAPTHLRRGIAYARQGNHDLAIADFTKVIFLQPLEYKAHLHRGTSYDEKGLTQKALDDYFKAVQLNPQSADAGNALAWFYATTPDPTLRNPKLALETAFKTTLQDNRPAHMDTLAAALVQSRQYVKAMDTYLWIMEQEPAFIKAYQSALKQKGLYNGSIDGTLNPAFLQTVTLQVQKEQYLEADWEYLPPTLFSTP